MTTTWNLFSGLSKYLFVNNDILYNTKHSLVRWQLLWQLSRPSCCQYSLLSYWVQTELSCHLWAPLLPCMHPKKHEKTGNVGYCTESIPVTRNNGVHKANLAIPWLMQTLIIMLWQTKMRCKECLNNTFFCNMIEHDNRNNFHQLRLPFSKKGLSFVYMGPALTVKNLTERI